MKIRGAGQRRPPENGYTAVEWIKGYVAWIAVLPIYVILCAFAALWPRLPQWARRKLLRSHCDTTAARKCDVRIPGDMSIPAYMLRWWKIKRNAFFNCYYHIVRRSDDDTALHDHPWWNFSIVLEGGYWEHTIERGGVHKRVFYGPGSVRFRPSGSFAHRLELERYPDNYGFGLSGEEKPVLTIFITGPALRRWGFHHENGWIDAYNWDEFCEQNNIGRSIRMKGYAAQNNQQLDLGEFGHAQNG
jgi:hypothetical protein